MPHAARAVIVLQYLVALADVKASRAVQEREAQTESEPGQVRDQVVDEKVEQRADDDQDGNLEQPAQDAHVAPEGDSGMLIRCRNPGSFKFPHMHFSLVSVQPVEPGCTPPP